MKDFYVFAYLNDDGSPYYISKGSGMDAYILHDGVKSPPIDKVKFFEKDLTLEEAVFFEGNRKFEYGHRQTPPIPLKIKRKKANNSGFGSSHDITGKKVYYAPGSTKRSYYFEGEQPEGWKTWKELKNEN